MSERKISIGINMNYSTNEFNIVGLSTYKITNKLSDLIHKDNYYEFLNYRFKKDNQYYYFKWSKYSNGKQFFEVCIQLEDSTEILPIIRFENDTKIKKTICKFNHLYLYPNIFNIFFEIKWSNDPNDDWLSTYAIKN